MNLLLHLNIYIPGCFELEVLTQSKFWRINADGTLAVFWWFFASRSTNASSAYIVILGGKLIIHKHKSRSPRIKLLATITLLLIV